jgi:hypothetical protein
MLYARPGVDRAYMFRQKIMEEKCTVVVVLAEYVRLGP